MDKSISNPRPAEHLALLLLEADLEPSQYSREVTELVRYILRSESPTTLGEVRKIIVMLEDLAHEYDYTMYRFTLSAVRSRIIKEVELPNCSDARLLSLF